MKPVTVAMCLIALFSLGSGMAAAQQSSGDRSASFPSGLPLPINASLLLLKADWSNAEFSQEIKNEMWEVLEGLPVPQELLDKLPASAPQILFPPEVTAIYKAEHFAQLFAWLTSKGLVVENVPFDAASQTLTRSYDFLDLPPLVIENVPPFLKREPAFRWLIGSRQSVGQFIPSGVWIERGLVIRETARGETEPRITTTADQQRFTLSGLAEGEAAIFHSFTDPFLRDAARRKGFLALIVLRCGGGESTNAEPRLLLPERVKTIQSQGSFKYPFASGGTLVLLNDGGYKFDRSPDEDSAVAQAATTAQDTANAALTRVFPLRNAQAPSAARIVSQLFAGISAVADERTNSVIIRADKTELGLIETLLTTLDKEMADAQAAPGVSAAGTRETPATDGTSWGKSTTRQSVGQLTMQFDSKEQKAAELARQIRELKTGEWPDKARLEKLTADLRRVVGESLAARHQLHRAELAQLAERMRGIEQGLEVRQRLRDQIIDHRVKDLLNPDLQWESRSSASGEPGGTSGAGLRAKDASGSWPTPAPAAVQETVGTTGKLELQPIPRDMSVRGISNTDQIIADLLGVKVQAVTGEALTKLNYEGGLLIDEVRPDGPAQNLRVGDIIVGLHIWKTRNPVELIWTLLQPISTNLSVPHVSARRTKESAILHFVRDGQPNTTSVDLLPWSPPPWAQVPQESRSDVSSPDLRAARAYRDKQRERWQTIETLFEQGRYRLEDALQSAKDLGEAEVGAAATASERRTARKEHLDRLKEIKSIVDAKFENGNEAVQTKLAVDAEVLKAEADLTAEPSPKSAAPSWPTPIRPASRLPER